MTRRGYACINVELSEKGISTNRGMIKRTFDKVGPSGAGELALLNIKNMHEIVKWNGHNNIFVYRMSSSIFPWMSEYEIPDLPQFQKILILLQGVGRIAKENKQRLSFHPGPFNVLCSPNEPVVKKTVKDLNQHAEIMDLMGLPQSPEYPINIHLGGAYGDKESTMKRFCEKYKSLSDSAKKRLVVENDDKHSMFSVKDLYDGIYSVIGIPITFDYHHHRFCGGGLTEEEAIKLASKTWGENRQLTHYSSCRKTMESPDQKAQAHADFLYEKIKTYGLSLDIEIEAKAKEQALLRYQMEEDTLLENYIEF
jgi:UV DNA damage endonuclease